MSKKKFISGLESLFGDTAEDIFQEELNALEEQKKDRREEEEEKSDRSSSGKDFSADLQSFLEESFEASLERQLRESEEKKSHKKRRKRPPSGLDLLIQRTVEESTKHPESPHQGLGKRITLLLDHEKLDKLKTIARKERTYLRNIIDEIVAEYIEAYEESKGKLG